MYLGIAKGTNTHLLKLINHVRNNKYWRNVESYFSSIYIPIVADSILFKRYLALGSERQGDKKSSLL